MEIKCLAHSEINLHKWDTCIQNASNSLVYAESWFLNNVAPNWRALVAEDYEYVMPLPVKKKYGITFLVQPPLTQQLGVFSSHIIDENIMEQFVKKIPYRSFHLNLNEQNPYSKGAKQPNLILDLNKDYRTIFSSYSTNTKRNINKAFCYQIEIKTDISSDEFIKFYHTTKKNYPVSPEAKVNSMINESFNKGKITLFGAYNINDELISALCLLHSSQRLIYLLPVSNVEGKAQLAMFGIVDTIIQKYANNNLILDFEGSKVESVANFYQGFGAKSAPYIQIKHWSINDLMKYFY